MGMVLEVVGEINNKMEKYKLTRPDISIVILCYRSNESIIPFINKVKSEIAKANISNYELVLVANYFENDGDETPNIVKKLEKYITYPFGLNLTAVLRKK